MWKLAEWKLRTYVAEPERGARKSKGKAAQQAGGVCCIGVGFPSAAAFAGRGERVGENVAHQVDTGRHGSAVCERLGERSQEASGSGGGLIWRC
jgi:hypothetical protein